MRTAGDHGLPRETQQFRFDGGKFPNGDPDGFETPRAGESLCCFKNAEGDAGLVHAIAQEESTIAQGQTEWVL